MNTIAGILVTVFLVASVAMIFIFPIVLWKSWWIRRKLIADPKLASNSYELIRFGINSTASVFGYLVFNDDSVVFYHTYAIRSKKQIKYSEISGFSSNKDSFLIIKGSGQTINTGNAIFRPLNMSKAKNYSDVMFARNKYLEVHETALSAVKAKLLSLGIKSIHKDLRSVISSDGVKVISYDQLKKLKSTMIVISTLFVIILLLLIL